MTQRICKGCLQPLIRERRRNGKLEHKARFMKKIYHDTHCRLIGTLRAGDGPKR